LDHARQLVLDLPARPALGRRDFFVSPANQMALALVESWPAWPQRRLAVAGPEGSGKSHLLHVWAALTGAKVLSAAEAAAIDLGSLSGDALIAIDDLDRLHEHGPAAEEAILHLCNLVAAGGGGLLTAGREAPARWRIALPDLASRLRAVTVARLEVPDDGLLSAVLVKLFADRQLSVAPGLIRYLRSRLDRSFAAAETIVTTLDRAGLAAHRPITARLAAEVLFADGDAGS
jgi:chromosomal replication initiation ATPase DnaA